MAHILEAAGAQVGRQVQTATAVENTREVSGLDFVIFSSLFENNGAEVLTSSLMGVSPFLFPHLDTRVTDTHVIDSLTTHVAHCTHVRDQQTRVSLRLKISPPVLQ